MEFSGEGDQSDSAGAHPTGRDQQQQEWWNQTPLPYDQMQEPEWWNQNTRAKSSLWRAGAERVKSHTC